METKAYMPGRLWIGSRARAFCIIINKYIISSYNTEHMVMSSAYVQFRNPSMAVLIVQEVGSDTKL